MKEDTPELAETESEGSDLKQRLVSCHECRHFLFEDCTPTCTLDPYYWYAIPSGFECPRGSRGGKG